VFHNKNIRKFSKLWQAKFVQDDQGPKIINELYNPKNMEQITDVINRFLDVKFKMRL
jgi:hypothetical protein